MAETTRISLVKPTLDTRYHIDFQWWSQNDRDWRVYLHNFLCLEHQKVYSSWDLSEEIDWVDPQTAEVFSVDALLHVLKTHCARQPGFITHQTTLVDSVFRLFLSNGNTPLSSRQLAEHLDRPPMTILKTLSGLRVYKGLRPCQE